MDLTPEDREPDIYVFPAAVVAKGLHYFYSERFSRSPSYVLALDSKPRGHTGDENYLTVGEHIRCKNYLGQFDALHVLPVVG